MRRRNQNLKTEDKTGEGRDKVRRRLRKKKDCKKKVAFSAVWSRNERQGRWKKQMQQQAVALIPLK